MKLKDKTVIVTGAGRGIGRAIALSVSQQGARLALVARTEKGLRETQKEIRADGGRAICMISDIRDSASVQAMVDEVIRQYQDIDILVNNAGVCFTSDVADCTDAEWEETLQTNLTGVFYCTRAVLPHLITKKSGQIINIVSGAGVHAFPGAAAYCASKFGVMGFSESLLEEVRSHGIRVTVVLPGMVNTGMVRDDRYARFQKIAPEDVAQAVLYAATSPESTLVSRVEVRHILPRK
jgi:3-oxoacyl-[acyl-carrier protein] reductase